MALLNLKTRRASTARRRSARRHVLSNGQRAANLRAITAARHLAAGMATSIATAAQSCGANKSYVVAAKVLLKAENTELLNRVLKGELPITKAAAQNKRVADLIAAYRSADDVSRITFAKTCGVEPILNMLCEAAE